MTTTKVLVVDADERQRAHLRGLFAHNGYFVECAGNAIDGIRLGLVLDPAVLVTDYALDDETNGVDLAVALRRHHERLPIVFVAERELEELEERSQSLPDAIFFTKAVSDSKLLETVAELITETP